MSDYYEDTSYYCYTTPAHYNKTPANSYYDYSPSNDDEIQAHPYPSYDIATPHDALHYDEALIYKEDHP
jgi:hypothetical protein